MKFQTQKELHTSMKSAQIKTSTDKTLLQDKKRELVQEEARLEKEKKDLEKQYDELNMKYMPIINKLEPIRVQLGKNYSLSIELLAVAKALKVKI